MIKVKERDSEWGERKGGGVIYVILFLAVLLVGAVVTLLVAVAQTTRRKAFGVVVALELTGQADARRWKGSTRLSIFLALGGDAFFRLPPTVATKVIDFVTSLMARTDWRIYFVQQENQ